LSKSCVWLLINTCKRFFVIFFQHFCFLSLKIMADKNIYYKNWSATDDDSSILYFKQHHNSLFNQCQHIKKTFFNHVCKRLKFFVVTAMRFMDDVVTVLQHQHTDGWQRWFLVNYWLSFMSIFIGAFPRFANL